ncbi:MAG: hypothetical protein U9Q71_04610, partial [Pseudomonadota bacterium]|nr:hypothetical protein [Pseudomonadota bacterium]
LSRPALFFGTNRKAPRCGACRKIATESPPAAGAVVCGNCGAEQALADLDWRRSACVARSVLIVRGIYESEAMPAEVLLQKLEELTGAAWDYCYIRDPVGMSS